MKDIKLDTGFKKTQYWISWFGFIAFGTLLSWLIAIALATYGKTTSNDVDSKKNVLNKTWQKFVFILGSILGDIFVISIILLILLWIISNML